jgi:hypothetical protein
LAASVAVGALTYLLVIRIALPRLADRLSNAQVEAVRAGFRAHPVAILIGIVAVAAILALPVLVAFRVAYGPLRGVDGRRVR